MSHGFQVFRPDGSVRVSLDARLSRRLGRVDITGSSSVNDPRFASGAPWWNFVMADPSLFSIPSISFAGTTLSWTTGAAPPGFYFGTLVYGVY